MAYPPVYVYSSDLGQESGFHNRGFKYADGFFETMRVVNGSIQWKASHERRISRSLKQLGFKGEEPNISSLLSDIATTWGVPLTAVNARVRITFFRNGKGGYVPEKFCYSWVGEGVWLSQHDYSFGVKGLQTKIYKDHPKLAGSSLSNVKSLAAMLYVQAGIWADKQQLKEVIILNHFGRVCEGLQSNIFLVKQGTVITPALEEGPVYGIMREQVISWCSKLGLSIAERKVEVAELYEADEVFFTNSIRGIQWCVGLDEVRYKTLIAKKLYQRFLAD